MIQIFKDGTLLYTIEGVDYSDIAIVSRNIVEKASMSTESFDEIYYSQVRTSSTYTEAYHRAEQIHAQTFGHRKYSDYESFRRSLYRRIK